MTNEHDPNDPDAGKCFCFTNPMKDFCKKFICIVSCLAIIISIALGGYGYTSITGSEFKPEVGEYKTTFTVPSSAVVATLCLVGCIFGIIIGLLGLCLCKWPNPCFSIIYFILAFISGLIAFIAGGSILGGLVSGKFKETACKAEVPSTGGKSYETVAVEQYSKYVDNLMCTDLCPCNEKQYVTGYADYSDSDLSPRTVASMKKDPAGFGNWLECYEKNIKTSSKTTACTAEETAKGCVSTSDADYEKFIKNGGVQFLSDFEKKFKCAGFCKPGLFYVTRNISMGKPDRDCLAAMQEEYGNNTGVGAVAVITGLILLVAAFGAIPLCTDYNKLEE